ncbi:MAG: phage holin family protein [Myxococcaceae bacterium]
MSRETERNEQMRFGSGGASIAGVFGGVAMATGVPWVLLAFGQALGTTMQQVLVATAVVVGGLMGLCAAFFGLVMPNQINHQPEPPRPERAEAKAQEERR